MTYTTTYKIKRDLGIQRTKDDALISNLREVAYNWINQQLGFVYNPSASSTRGFHAVDNVRRNGLDLVTGYLHTITSVVNGDGETIGSGFYIIVENRILRLRQNSGLRWNWNGNSDPTNAIQITAYFGLLASVPDTVDYLERQLVIWMYRAMDTSIPMEVSFITATGMLLMPSTIPPNIRELVERLRPLL